MDTTIKKPDKKSLFYLAIIIVAFLVAVSLIYYFSKQQPTPIKEMPWVETKILTPEKIQEALSKKTEPSSEIQPLTEKEVKQSLEKKIPANEKPEPLTPEEIQQILNKKIE